MKNWTVQYHNSGIWGDPIPFKATNRKAATKLVRAGGPGDEKIHKAEGHWKVRLAE